jgi:hypothetical protein
MPLAVAIGETENRARRPARHGAPGQIDVRK